MADLERIRLVVLGGAGVGKSAIIRRLLGQGFTERYRPTVEDLYSRECVLGTLTFKVDLLDTAGTINSYVDSVVFIFIGTQCPGSICESSCGEK